MNIKRLLSSLDFSPAKERIDEIKKESLSFVDLMKKEMTKQSVPADVFIGGSFAKGTLVKKENHDVDVFIRFDWRIDDISDPLESVLKKVCKNRYKLERIHGSRDYFKVIAVKGIVFEIIPVTKIKKPSEARNVTDLSYFHVNYVKRRIKSLVKQVALAKRFCEAQKVYGAESYIRGFSGYALECLIIHYGSFERMLRELSKVKERIVIDSEKKYKNKKDVVFELNESKIEGPIVLVDPTWRERNVLAALSKETFERFQKAAKEFLNKPSEKFFEIVKISREEMTEEARKNKAELLHVKLETDRQEGDIAGTKLKKFSDFLAREAEKYYYVVKKEFEYSEKNYGNLYLILKSRGNIVRIGPPIFMKQHVAAFKKMNKDTFVKNKMIHAKIKSPKRAGDFADSFKKMNKERMKEMGITGLRVI